MVVVVVRCCCANVTVAVRADGRILQPDKPATAVDSMFAQAKGDVQQKAPSGEVWSTYVTMEQMIWYYILSIDVKIPWKISEIDLFPSMVSAVSGTNKWVAHQWFKGHIPTPCQHGSHALASGCVVATVRYARTSITWIKSLHALPSCRQHVRYSLL